MRPNVPQSQIVSTAFRQLRDRLRVVENRINASAAKEMKLGKYQNAQGWIKVGETVAEYLQRVKAFEQEWKHIVRTARITSASTVKKGPVMGSTRISDDRTPAWKFCEPALVALFARGGRATLEEILSDLEKTLAGSLSGSDRVPNSKGGKPKWYDQVQQAYRQCQSEGWIDKNKRRNGDWIITDKGRAIAEKHS